MEQVMEDINRDPQSKLMDLKELEKLLKICRRQGVIKINFAGNQIEFGDLPPKQSNEGLSDEVPTDELSQDELMFYHIQGGK